MLRKGIVLGIVLYGLLHLPAMAAIVTFDDLYVSEGIPISNPYDGLMWTNFFPVSTNWFNTPNGFVNACVSGADFAENGGGGQATISGALFNLNSGHFAAGWRDNLQLQVEGFLKGGLVYSNTYLLSATSGSTLRFDYQGVDVVTFSASGGTQHAGYSGDGTFFGMDNLDVDIIEDALIDKQPADCSSLAGGSASFSVSAYGSPPFRYQWFFNGTTIDGATNATLTLTNVQSWNQGEYNVIVYGTYSSTVSSNATLTVTASPPEFVTQPTIQFDRPPLVVTIFAGATGSLPITYQWRTNGINIAGATSNVITITDAASIDAANYDLIASNAIGSVTSSIVPLFPRRLTAIVGWGNNLDSVGNVVGEATPPIGLVYGTAIAAGGNHSLALSFDGSVTGWGDNGAGQSTVPVGLSNVTEIAAGYNHSLALKSDGTVVAWGSDGSGESDVPPGLSNVVAIAAGGCDCLPAGNLSLALKSDGTVVGWGTTTVPADLTNIQAIAAGDNHALALKRDGTVVGWGADYNGQTTSPPGLSNVVAVAAGGYHSMALRLDGTVVAWGNNSYGQTNVPSGLNHVAAIAAGENFSAALRRDGTVVAWGSNSAGESVVPAGLSNIVAIAAGARHMLALQNDGTPVIVRQPVGVTVYSGARVVLEAGVVGPSPLSLQWQLNGTNLVGATNSYLVFPHAQPEDAGSYLLVASNPDTGVTMSTHAVLTVITSPPAILDPPSNSLVFAGGTATFSVSVTGSTPVSYQWQFNGTNLIDATNSILTLTNLSWPDGGVYSVVVSNAYGKVTSSNAVLALPRSQIVGWGNNFYGQTNVPPTPGNVLAVAAGDGSSLALLADGRVAAWGWNAYGETNVPAGLSNVLAIAAGAYHDLALRQDGTVVGWGLDGLKQASPPSGLTNVIAIAAGDSHSLALRDDGTVIAWGDNSYGQTNVPTDLTNATAIAAGGNFSMALRSDGTVLAWGDNGTGETNVPSGLTPVEAIAAGSSHALALEADGTVAAWGASNYGQTNVPPGLTQVTAIAAGAFHSVALKNDSTVVAWGQEVYGQTNVPAGLAQVVGIAAGTDHTLALREDGPPWVAVQPRSHAAYAGDRARLSVSAIGIPPLRFQWQFNGTNIDAATNAVLTLANLQTNEQGSYSVWITNRYGSSSSSNAFLTVLAVPPDILAPPSNQVALVGSRAVFSVTAVGPKPLNYQWQHDGVDITGSTNASLTLTNIQPADEGPYDVVVGNAWGDTISSNAFLTVVDLATALNAMNLVWTNNGEQPWLPEITDSHDGVGAATTGPLKTYQSCLLQTGVSGPGTLSFWWKISGFLPASMSFLVDSNLQVSLSLPTDWQPETVYVPAGNHLLQWRCVTYYSFSSSTGWLDQVSYTPGATGAIVTSTNAPPPVPAGTNVTLSVNAGGTPPLAYQWQFNGADIPGTTGASLILNNVQSSDSGTYSVLVTNAYGSDAAAMELQVTPSAPAIWAQPTNEEAAAGGTCVFGVTARGTLPLFYQWFCNGTLVPGATNSLLLLADVQPSNGTNYTVVVTNRLGSVTSSNATLRLVPSLLVAWGDNSFGQCTIPWSLTNVGAFAGGWGYTVAANAGGSVTNWGFSEPDFPADLTNVTALAAGANFALALKSDGTVVGAGTSVPAGLSNIVSIACGQSACLALRADGSIVAWGGSSSGLTNVPPGLSNVMAIACGWLHALALKRDGTIVAWGSNAFGQTNVPAGLTHVAGIAAGWYHSLALKDDGTVVAWGNNSSGQTNTPAGLSNVVAICGGSDHSLALRSDGTVVAWGGHEGETNIPVIATNVVAISCGSTHCLALVSNGAPVFARAPMSETVTAGNTAILNAWAVGAQPMQYQWRLNGATIPGATNALLILTNLPVTSAGIYQCAVSNAAGSGLTTDATVSLTRLPLRFDTSTGLPEMTDAGLHLRILNLAGAGTVTVEASTNLVSWQPIFVHASLVGSLDFTDMNAAGFPRRFYRVREGGSQEVGPVRLDNASATNGGFAFRVRGLSGRGAVILSTSTNLVNWIPIFTNPAVVGTIEFLDPATNSAVKFYRAEER